MFVCRGWPAHKQDWPIMQDLTKAQQEWSTKM